ncbi:MAG TPA: hypothetical protein VJC06_03130 [Candidatus Paceibacterota bacterium]
MKNKIIITTSLVVILLAVGGVWFYLDKAPVVSYQFDGTTLEVREDNMTMIGDYIKLEQNNSMVGGSKVVTVSFDSNTKIIKNTIETKSGSGFEKPIEPGDQKQKIATIAELKDDLKKNNLVLTINSEDDIYNLDIFTAASIEYTMLIFK